MTRSPSAPAPIPQSGTAQSVPPPGRALRRGLWIVGLLLVALFVIRILPNLGGGTFQSRDEYLTLDRTYSMLSTGDWTTVWTNHEPSFRKPPLQYWAGAALLAAGLDREVALRAMPLLYGLGMLGLTGLLGARMARDLLPARRCWLVGVAAMVMLCGSRGFWRYSTEAMLDAGTGFWLVATATAFLSALHRPARIWLVVLCVLLGALQKAPVAGLLALAGLVAAAVDRRVGNTPDLPLLRPKARATFSAALICLVPATLIWPILQVGVHGFDAFRLLVMDEMVGRFAPEVEAAAGDVDWPTWVIHDSALLWLPGLAALAALPFWLRSVGARMIWIWGLCFFLALTFARGETYARYLLSVSPFVAVALALSLFRLLRFEGRAFAAAATIGLLAPGLPSAEVGHSDRRRLAAEQALTLFAATAAPEDRLLACQTSSRAREVLITGAVGFFGSAGQPVGIFRDPGDLADYVQDTPPGTVLRGICLEPDMAQIRALRPDLTETRDGEFVLWSAPARP